MTENSHEIIKKEVLEDDNEVREQFLNVFRNDVFKFIDLMGEVYKVWRKYDDTIGTNKRKAYVSAFLFNAFNNLASSMKLYISGYSIPSGNLIRQTLESLCTAILCSKESLQYYIRVDQNKFSPQKAVNLVQKNANKLKVNKDSISVLKKSYEFYHQFSHSSLLALTHNLSLSNKGSLFIGPSFDEEKLLGYIKEIAHRLSLAEVFPNIIQGILLAEKENENS